MLAIRRKQRSDVSSLRPCTAFRTSGRGPGPRGCSATSARKMEPFSPSIRRWSKDRARVVIQRGTISSSTTHGCLRTAPKARIAASPGLMIGVPASTPKTPTLVIVNEPPAWSAGWVLPSRAVATRSFSARAELGQGEGVGVLDVRDDQPARGGRGDAEVDRALVDDLLRLLVPRRVDDRRTAGRQRDRLRDDQQRRDLELPERLVALEPVDQLHRGADVHGDPLGHMRCRERTGHHRLRHHLLHTLDRHAGVFAPTHHRSSLVRRLRPEPPQPEPPRAPRRQPG